MTYLTYEEYSNMGGVLDLTAFNRFESRACGIIDNATHNRIECMVEVPQRAKTLCRDLIEYLANDFGSSKQVSSHSQSAGGVSESESYVTKTMDEINCEMQNIVYDYLACVTNDYFVPLMYRGAIG